MTSEQIRVECEPIPFSMVPKWITLHPKLSLGARALYAALLHYSTMPEGSKPSIRQLCEDLGGASRSSIKRYLDELIQLRAVERHERYRENGGRTSNLYVLMVTPPRSTGEPAPGPQVNRPPVHRRTTMIKNEASDNDPSPPQTPQRGAAGREGSLINGEDIHRTLVELYHPSGPSRAEERKIRRVGRDLIAKGATADEIRRRHRNGESVYTVPMSCRMLLEHWDQLAKIKQSDPSRVRSADQPSLYNRKVITVCSER